jgi:hypothetical protein
MTSNISDREGRNTRANDIVGKVEEKVAKSHEQIFIDHLYCGSSCPGLLA